MVPAAEGEDGGGGVQGGGPLGKQAAEGAQSWRYKPGQYIAGASGCGPPALPYTRA